MNSEKRGKIFDRLRSLNPAPTTELEFSTAFELLVAVLLSAQATDVSVNAATRRLFPKANTPQSILALGTSGLEPYIRTIGLYKTKARHLIQTCEILLREHQGNVPENREALESLPGVGRKPPMWCSTRRLVGRRLQSIRIFFVSLIEQKLPPEKMSRKLRHA